MKRDWFPVTFITVTIRKIQIGKKALGQIVEPHIQSTENLLALNIISLSKTVLTVRGRSPSQGQ